MDLRIKEVVKNKGFLLEGVANKLGISYVALYKRLNTPKLSTLEEIATILNCPVQELLEAPEGYAHFYDDKTGEWLGIRKK